MPVWYAISAFRFWFGMRSQCDSSLVCDLKSIFEGKVVSRAVKTKKEVFFSSSLVVAERACKYIHWRGEWGHRYAPPFLCIGLMSMVHEQ